MKTVLFLESGLHGGGSFKSLKKHILALDLTKINPIVVFLNKTGMIKELQEMKIKVYLISDTVFTEKKKMFSVANALFMKGFIRFSIVPFLNWIHKKAIQQLSVICKTEKVEIIHLNTELFRDRVGLLVAKKLNVKVVAHLRSKYELGAIHFNRNYIKLANNLIHKYIAVSKDTADFWIKDVGISENKCMVLYDYYATEIDSESGGKLNKTNLKFVCVANLVPVKAHKFLLKGIRQTLLKHNAKLFLVGKGEDDYVDKLKKITIELGISNNVCFLGFRNDIPEILASSDIVLLTSKREGLPNILIESLGLGCIVLATNVGGIPEIIKDKLTGFTTPYGDVKRFKNTVENIIELSESELAKIRSKAKLKVFKKFNFVNYKTQILKLYE